MLVWLIHNGINQETFLKTIEIYEKAATIANIRMETYETCDFIIICDKEMTIYNTKSHLKPDCIILLAKDVYLAKLFERAGYTVLNSSFTIENASNKANTYEMASKNKIPIPSSLIFPRLAEGKKIDYSNWKQQIEEKFNYPFIIKEFYGSFGRQVYLIYNSSQLIPKMTRLLKKGFIVQRYIENSYGRDARLYVVNHKIASSIVRHSVDDFRSLSNSNIKGNCTKIYTPKQAEIDIAIKMSHLLKSFIISVDLIWDEEEKPLLCEVNSAANINSIVYKPLVESISLALRSLKFGEGGVI